MTRLTPIIVSLLASISSADIIQKPLEHVDAEHSDVTIKSPPHDALVTVYNKPKYPCYTDRDDGKQEFSVPVDTCVSANFSINVNVRVTESARCAGGRKPALVIYQKAKCTGGYIIHEDFVSHRQGGSNAKSPSYCLPNGFKSSRSTMKMGDEWSMYFRCQDTESDGPRVNMEMDIYLPQPKPKQDVKKRPGFASVSDTTCLMDRTKVKEFFFQKPEPDMCVNVEAGRWLSIYRNAQCPNGTEALFAQFEGRDCKGEPRSLEEVNDGIMSIDSNIPCLGVGGQGEGSYAFWCSGELKRGGKVREGEVSRDDGSTKVKYQISYDRKIVVEEWEDE